MNIVKLLGITYKEDIISNLLVGLLNESTLFKNMFLEKILKMDNPSVYEVKAYARIATSFGVPDIIISINGESGSSLIIIENKLKADEGLNQTLRYSNKECINELKNNMKIDIKSENLDIKFIYLTLIPEQNPSSKEFINLTYEDLITRLDVNIEDEVLNRVYKDLCSILSEFYEGLDIKEDYKIMDILNDELDNERAFIKFKKIVEGIRDVNGLTIKHIGKTGGKGRVSFYAKISKDSWLGKDSVELVDDVYTITDECYDIHIELSFDIFNKVITLPLHYETRPYIPKNRLLSKSREKDYNLYCIKRDKIKNLIHNKIWEMNDSNIKTYNGSNQIACIKLQIDDNLNVKDFRNKIQEYMGRLGSLVDMHLE